MEQNYDKDYWKTPCPSIQCRKTAYGLIFVLIPAAMGDDSPGSPVAPKNGAYSNAIVEYEANKNIYIYSAEGVPVRIAVDISKIEKQIRELTTVVEGKADIADLAAVAFSGRWADLIDRPEVFTAEGWSDLWL